ncbi:MAG: helix-turn-helix transcriptional regulator [Candidatus Woesearchaeota archaeon]
MVLSKNRLKEFREKKGLTQEELAAKANVSRQTIISIESARYVPSLELALKFSKIFNCKVEELFGI